MKIDKMEYVQRMEKLQKLIAENEMDLFLVTAQDSIYYLTGVTYKPLERPFFLLLREKGKAVILVPALEKEHLSAAPNVSEVYSYWDYPAPAGEGWLDKLKGLLDGVGNIGVEPTAPLEITKGLSNFNTRCLPLVEKVRIVKSENEVEMLRQSARFADTAIARVIDNAYFGVSELELFSQGRKIQMNVIKNCEYDVLNTEILAGAWPGPMSAQPHYVPAVGDRLKQGSHIALTLMRVNGYSTECERTFFLEKPVKEAVDAFRTMLEARKLAFGMVKPGAKCSDIDIVTKEFLVKKGYGEKLLHRTGHGFGLGAHEGPWISEGSEDILEKNMLVSVEPGIYLVGIGGIRHSDTVLVTDDGCESLTKYPTDIESLTIASRKPFKRLMGSLVQKYMGL
jgi:Xaa-Pro aminopeptidase